MSGFDRLHPALRHHLVNSLGWRELRPVQDLAIGAFLDGADLVVLAPTAGGKTEAAFFPILSRALSESWGGLSVIYVSPIRALLNNQRERLERYFGLVGRRAACWHGDIPRSEKRRILADPPDCLLTTPESLEVLLVSGQVDHRSLFRSVRAVVVDELHAFAGDDRGWHLLSVLSRIGRIAGGPIQRVGLSATVGNPAEMLEWLSSDPGRDRRVIDPPPVGRPQPEVQVDYVGSLTNAARVIAALHRGEKRLVFCDSRARVEELALMLRKLGVETFVSHSSLGAEERRLAEHAFANRPNCVIVATSSLELGIDVGDLDRVIQIDAPATVSSFLQRMGRTGRRPGTASNCLFLATDDEPLLRAAALVRLRREGFVEPVIAPPRPYHILAQQLMALCLQERGLERRDWGRWLGRLPASAGLTPQVAGGIVEHMVTSGILWGDGGLLAFAPEGEAAFGRRNFLDLLSVFTSPPLFRVLWGNKELGEVHESTFLNRDDEPGTLVLAGRCWATTHVDWRRRIAHVEPTERHGRSRWIGEGRFLGGRVCRAIQGLLATEDVDAEWSRRAATKIGELRAEFSWLRAHSTALVRDPDGRVAWWTFAGGVANTILARRLESSGRAKGDNLAIRFEGDPPLDSLREQILQTCSPDMAAEPDPAAIDRLKFSAALPPSLSEEVYLARFSDRESIETVLGQPIRAVSLA